MVEVRHIVLILHNGVYMFSMHGDGQECVNCSIISVCTCFDVQYMD